MAARRSGAKANNPFWSNHVAAWYGSALDAEHYCRKHVLSATSLMRWARNLPSAEDLRKRSEDLQKMRRKERERPSTNRSPKRPKRPRHNRYSGRTDSGPIALRTFRSMHVKATNWSGMWHAGVCHSARFYVPCVADLARSGGAIRQRNGLANPALSERPGPIKQRC